MMCCGIVTCKEIVWKLSPIEKLPGITLTLCMSKKIFMNLYENFYVKRKAIILYNCNFWRISHFFVRVCVSTVTRVRDKETNRQTDKEIARKPRFALGNNKDWVLFRYNK